MYLLLDHTGAEVDLRDDRGSQPDQEGQPPLEGTVRLSFGPVMDTPSKQSRHQLAWTTRNGGSARIRGREQPRA